MILGRVVGEVWAARRHPGLVGRKLLIIEPHYWYDPPFPVAHLVAVDALGAGPGDDVVVCLGEPARQSLLASTPGPAAQPGDPPGYASAAMLPIEATVMAIVDQVQLQAIAEQGSLSRRPLQTVLPSSFAQAVVPSWSKPDVGSLP
jgi:ethanolamine utilization protein EutN